MLTEDQTKFLDRYVISKGPKVKDRDALDKLGIKERKAEVNLARDRILDGSKVWLDKAKGLKGAPAQDRLLNYGWMDRDANAYAAMYKQISVFLTPEEKAQCETASRVMKQEAEAGRLSLKNDVETKLVDALHPRWPYMARDAEAPGKSRKELLQAIEAIEAEMDDMRMSLKLAGSDPAKVDAFKPKVEELRTLYDGKVPAFDGTKKTVPPMNETEPPLTYSDDVCLKIYDLCGRNWFTLKKQYKAADFVDKVANHLGRRPKDGTEVMWELWAFRKKVVDGLIGEATAKFGVPGKGSGWVAVGSTNLESDYDLSVMLHGETGEDWEVVDWFNRTFQSRYATQPGIMFDTNLYATAPSKARMSDNPETPAEKAMAAMAFSGQDVGALMKQRRFMSWEEYEGMMNTVLDAMEADGVDAAIVQATRTQFEEADDRYQMSQVRMLDPGQKVLDRKIGELEKAEGEGSDPARAQKLKEMKELKAALAAKLGDVERSGGSAQAQLILEAVHLLEGAEDVILEVNNAIYVDAVKESRALENEAAARAFQMEEYDKRLEYLTAIDGASPEQIEEIATVQKQLDAMKIEFEGMAARSKDLFTDAVFFANEAYHSDGPFKHIVEATQAVDSDVQRLESTKAGEAAWDKLSEDQRRPLIAEAGSEEKAMAKFVTEEGQKAWKALGKEAQGKLITAERTERRGKLSLHECLQSFNEQLGDFIKDLHHHAADKDEDLPGTGFFRSSKYLDRLVDAVDLLEQKAKGGLGVKIPGKMATLAEYRTALNDGLLALRKGKITIEKEGATDEEQQEQMEAFAIAEIKRLFGVSTLHDLGKAFKGFGSSVNAKLRAQVALEMKALSGDKSFFA